MPPLPVAESNVRRRQRRRPRIGFIFRGQFFVAVYVVGAVLPCLQVWYWFAGSISVYSWLLAAVAGIPFSVRSVSRRLPDWMARVWSRIAWTWIGLYFQFFFLFVAGEIAWLLLPISGPTVGATVMGAFSIVAAASLIGGHWIHVRNVPIETSLDLGDQVLVQLSDVHIGSRSRYYLRRIVRRIQKLRPTVVVITGDLVDSSAVNQDDLRFLGDLDVPCLFTTGNHEHYANCEQIVDWLRNTGVRPLRNESASVGPFQFVGIDDSDSADFVGRVLQTVDSDPNRYRVLLYHRPQGEQYAASWGFNLMLSGHTHNGQVWPFRFLVRKFFEKTYGLYKLGEMHLRVSCGTGTWGPLLRFGTRNEIVRIVFEPSNA